MGAKTPQSSSAHVPRAGRLDQIDDLLNLIQDAKKDALESTHLLRRLCEELLRHENTSVAQRLANPVRTCFDSELPLAAKRFIAGSFLRVLPDNPSVFQDLEINTGLHRLFDAVLSDVYGPLKITARTERFHKEQILSEAVLALENQIEGAIDAFRSLSDFGSVRQELKRGLNSAIAKIMVWPFTSRELVTVKLDTLCATVAEYQTAKTDRKFPLLEKARATATEYVAEAKAANTTYADWLRDFASHALTHLEADFADSPLSKPATLSIKPSPKKYPLAALGSRISLLLTVANAGPGRASDVEVEFETSENLAPTSTRRYLGDMEPGTTIQDVDLECDIISVEGIAIVNGTLRWYNFGQTQQAERFYFGLEGQRSDIDWASLDTEDPYSTEAIADADQLVGRAELMTQLMATLSARNAGSFYILGQKRVGKTSLVKAVATRLGERNGKDYLALYLDAGDYVHPDPNATIALLGKKLCQGIKEWDPRFRKVSIPKFDRALAPLDEFLREVIKLVPTFRVVFILDEFDQLPVEIYRRGPVGDSFFLTLRSISSKPPFAFVLVGGEKMEFIVSAQGDQLNKFQRMRVDYFDKETHWSDFQDLLRKPVREWFEVSDEAVSTFYGKTEGNPYFTKLIAREMFRTLVRRRDSHVTPKEVREAAKAALHNTGENVFQHFWEDGILVDSGDREEERSMFRRRVLLSLSDVLQTSDVDAVSRAAVVEQARQDGLDPSEVEKELQDFERRQVLLSQKGQSRTRVTFFGEWLRDRGVQEIVTTFTDKDSILKRKGEEARLRISEEELLDLTGRWPTYKGRTIGPEAVRHWLSQFGRAKDQRLMLKLLQELRFYGSDFIREKLKQAHGDVERLLTRRGLVNKMEGRKRSRRDVLISYLGGPGKSGLRYAQLYAEVNGILSDNIVERERIPRELEKKPEIQALVFADDFVGSGQSGEEYLEAFAGESGAILRNRQLSVVYAIVAGFGRGIERIDETARKLALTLTLYTGDPLSASDSCFADSSRVFPDVVDRSRARELAQTFGKSLVKDAPFGYGDTEAAVVFEFNCPNNSLPILWAESSSWKPLFKRL